MTDTVVQGSEVELTAESGETFKEAKVDGVEDDIVRDIAIEVTQQALIRSPWSLRRTASHSGSSEH